MKGKVNDKVCILLYSKVNIGMQYVASSSLSAPSLYQLVVGCVMVFFNEAIERCLGSSPFSPLIYLIIASNSILN